MVLHSPLDAYKGILGDLRGWFTSGADYSAQEVRNLYATSQTIYRCANIRAENVSAVPFRAVDKDGKPIEHPVNAVFASRWNFKNVLNRSEMTLFFQGSNLVLPQTSAFGDFKPNGANLRWYNPRVWSKEADDIHGLRGFRIIGHDFVPAEEALYFYGFDFNDDFEGVAPAEVAYYAAGGQAELWQTIHSFMMNRAIPAALVQPAENSSALRGVDAPKKLRKLFESMFQGSKNTGKNLVSPDRLEIQLLQLDMEKAGVATISPEQRKAIAEASDVPMLLIDFSEATFANGDAAVQFWYRHWLKPRAEWYAGNFSDFFSRWYHEELIIEPDFTGIIIEDDDTDRINSQLAAGYRDLYSAQVDTGMQADERLKDIYMVGGVPTHIDAIVSAAKPTPAPLMLPSQPPPLTLLPAVASSHIPDPIYNEIEIAARKGADFVAVELPEHTETYIKALHGAGIEKPDIIRAAKAFYLSVTAAKAIQSTRLDFENDFDDLLAAARHEDIRRKNFGRELMGLIERYTERAYKDGLIDGGVADAVLDDEDMAALNAVILEQRAYVRGFTDKLYGGDGISDELAGQKAAMWFNGSIYPSYVKGLNSAARNSYFLWVMDQSKENCVTCIALDGQIHRMKDYVRTGYTPNSDKLVCGKGKQCGCKLVPAPGEKASGSFPAAKSLLKADPKPIPELPANTPPKPKINLPPERGDRFEIEEYEIVPPKDEPEEKPDKPEDKPADSEKKYNPGQPRDAEGQWTEGGGSGGSGGSDKPEEDNRNYRDFGSFPETMVADSYQRNAPKPTDKQANALEYYRSNEGNLALNRSLRRGDDLSPEAKRQSKQLDSILESSTLEHDSVLYRGIRGGSNRMREFETQIASGELKVGSTIRDHGYASTTLSRDIADSTFAETGGAIFKINAPKGSNGLYLNSSMDKYVGGRYQNADGFRDEMEVLLPRDAEFYITNIQKNGNQYEVEMSYR